MNRWRVVVGGVSMNLALGSLYAWSVFVLPLEQEFGWTRSQTSWVYTIAVVVFASTFVLAGRIQDQRGPRRCALAGAILVSLGFFAASFTTSLWFLYVAFGLVVGAGNGFGYATPMPVASKWFPDRRGLVVGLMVGGYGAGSAVIGPIATTLITSVGWRPTFRLLGVVFLAMGLVGAWLLENPPQGYRPAGWTPPASAALRRDYSTRRDAAHAAVLRALDRVRVRHDRRTDDDQPARAVRAQRRARGGGRDAGASGHGSRQRRRPDSVGLAVRRASAV